MTERVFPYRTADLTAPRLGLIALQADETIEGDLRRLMSEGVEMLVSRVASDVEVTRDTLAAMEGHLTAAAALFPADMQFDVVGYGCTSGTAQIGDLRVAEKVRSGTRAAHVTQPLSALVAACRSLGVRRLAVLSPYVAEVSARLREVLQSQGIETAVFGSFHVSTEATVVRIDAPSIRSAALALVGEADVDAVFLSCTNLRTLDVIRPLEAQLDMPVLSSNQVLAWHMMELAGLPPGCHAPGRLFTH
jgi:maleate isomerase